MREIIKSAELQGLRAAAAYEETRFGTQKAAASASWKIVNGGTRNGQQPAVLARTPCMPQPQHDTTHSRQESWKKPHGTARRFWQFARAAGVQNFGAPTAGSRDSHNDPDSKISLKDTNLKVRAADSATLAVAWYQAEAAAARITIRGTSATRTVLRSASLAVQSKGKTTRKNARIRRFEPDKFRSGFGRDSVDRVRCFAVLSLVGRRSHSGFPNWRIRQRARSALFKIARCRLTFRWTMQGHINGGQRIPCAGHRRDDEQARLVKTQRTSLRTNRRLSTWRFFSFPLV